VGAPLSTRGTPVADWARWVPSEPFTLGVEEEVMLLDPAGWDLAQRIDDVLPRLPGDLAHHMSAETHQGAIELATEPRGTVADAVAQLAALRARLAAELGALGLVAAVAGTHPTAVWQDTRVSPSSRHQLISQTMGELARREPTFALHVHVGVDDPERAIGVVNRLRAHLPLLLALSANSPFWQGRDARLASARTAVFGAFPRTGIPRRFASYEDWRATVDVLIRCGAFPEPTFLWWDVRPQPRYGTVEVRIMDAQTTVTHTAALAALVQALARWAVVDGPAPDGPAEAAEVLAENRFLAARDGVAAEFVDPVRGDRRPVTEQVDELLCVLRPHAEALGCGAELAGVAGLMARTGAGAQRVLARDGIDAVVPALAARFSP
jgi:glutamate---cysteine ligase / carboxylate-amine ligase